ncbi:MAG: hypothetical protein ABI855_19285 [Bacteroidota bacterium]
MKTSNQKIFLAYPATLIAAIVDKAQQPGKGGYELAVQQIVEGYNNLGSENIVAICDSPYFEMLSQDELDMLMNYVYSKLGTVSSFTVRKFNPETSMYKIECEKGSFKMILVLDSENKINAIDFIEEEVSYLMSEAA